ncbi:hypothetical protein G7A66_03320 [Altererythrobacter sp. SALINAS58]|uniref:hypothetical protein n=1 Tax=Alteripontixanthobacter muriae TaxID=2705546 RepID=UPI001576D8C4|nr:hypothetical protein [Alteripontixanthobacter muriae]NTZ42138.1 hypothetical protein [Alteripontixanthobacter muriae]
MAGKKSVHRGTYLARQVGEHLVVSELGRRGICATTFAGNVPEFDILASRDGRTLGVQVKSAREGSWHLNASRYLEIELAKDIQTVKGVHAELDEDLIYIFVKLGDAAGEDRLYLLTQGDLAGLVEDQHTAYLHKHGGRRPRAPGSFHSALNETQLAPWSDNWALIERALEAR